MHVTVNDMLHRIDAMLARVSGGLDRFARGPGAGRYVYFADSAIHCECLVHVCGFCERFPGR